MKKTPQLIRLGLLGLAALLVFSACSPTATATPSPIPTLDASLNGWQEYSSKYTYSNRDTLETGFLKYSLHYPPGWYLYPGTTIMVPGYVGITYIQNFERVGNDMELEPQSAGTVKLLLFAMPCKVTQEGCLTNLPELAPGLPGIRKVELRSLSKTWTIWTAALYTRAFMFSLAGYMIGTPEENAGPIKTLDKILSTLVIPDGGIFPPAHTPTPGPTYPPGPATIYP